MYPDEDTYIMEVRINLMHNLNPIATIDARADAGNGGYYYSIASLVVKDVHYPIVASQPNWMPYDDKDL